MKNTFTLVSALILGACFVHISTLQAQTAVVNGLVTGVGKSDIQVKSSSAANPFRIAFSPYTTLTDETGNPIPMARITEGQQVMVYYSADSGTASASKIILKTVVGANPKGGATQRRDQTMSTTR